MDNFFGYFGFMAFFLILFNLNLPSKVKKLEKKLKTLNKFLKKEGENKMSHLISSLKSQNCIIDIDSDISENFSSLLGLNDGIECTIVDVDDEWVKIAVKDKKGELSHEIIRIDHIMKIKLISK